MTRAMPSFLPEGTRAHCYYLRQLVSSVKGRGWTTWDLQIFVSCKIVILHRCGAVKGHGSRFSSFSQKYTCSFIYQMFIKYLLYAWQCVWHRNCEADFSSLCQRLSVFQRMHIVIIYSHFEYIKSVFEGMSCSVGDPSVPMSLVPCSAPEHADACHCAPSMSLSIEGDEFLPFFLVCSSGVMTCHGHHALRFQKRNQECGLLNS